ncbi:MAG TPA: CSLREA domain-containing protein, partial [Dehalococcoidia bacterium]|nr:CSLREA domain-containing protein [Dehalococcoidia bacterium]
MHNSITMRRVTVLSLVGIVALALLLLFTSTSHVQRAHAAPPFPTSQTLIVNSAGDQDDDVPGDGFCDTGAVFLNTCTLRAAIEEANAFAGAANIYFDPLIVGQTVHLTDNLTPILEQVNLDASFCGGAGDNCTGSGFGIDGQWNGESGNSCLILDEGWLGGSRGAEGKGSIVRGLSIHNCSGHYNSDDGDPAVATELNDPTPAVNDYDNCDGDGICIQSNGNHMIGGDAGFNLNSPGPAPAGQGNILYANECNGLHIDEGFSSGGDTVVGNRIGTSPDGMAGWNFLGPGSNGNGCDGVHIVFNASPFAGDITVGLPGGTGPQGFRNIIAANDDDGIGIYGPDVRVNILNNYIGLNVTGQSFDSNTNSSLSNGDDAIEGYNEFSTHIIGNRIGGGFLNVFVQGPPVPFADSNIGISLNFGTGGHIILGNCIGFTSSCAGPAWFRDEDITLREENALPNYIGDGTIGGRNVMGNVLNEDFGDTGIYVFDSEVHINNNYVGVAVDGASPANIVGECVLIDSDFDPYMSTVVNNVIGYCSDDGVALRRSDNINAPTTALAGDGPRSFLVDNNKIGLEV